ncbi:MAG TPA: hypothetical protein VFP68_16115 [Burkholderiaceae bacterium]|nr:hypothetical protein [Burkholderiaceae bacterium]
MDPIESLPPTAASWLRSSAIAPFVPAYWRHLMERKYSAGTPGRIFAVSRISLDGLADDNLC